MRDLETVLCRLHSSSQPRYPRFILCPECRAEAPHETIVVEAVVNYFSKPEFQEFFIETEREIQMGSKTRRADIVLRNEKGHFIAIVECKQIGVVSYGHEQLKSYLCATDTQFGVFANSIDPIDWEFYENLRGNLFTSPFKHFLFERKDTTGRTIESIREEKSKLGAEIQKASAQYSQKIREVESSCEQLGKLNTKIKQRSEQLAQFEEKIAPVKKEIRDLQKKNARLKAEITQNSKRAEVLEGLKLESIRASLKEDIHSLHTKKDQLENEIGTMKQQYTYLLGEINSLKEDKNKLENLLQKNKDKFKRVENKIRSEREILEREKEIWKDGEKGRKNYNDYLEQINAKLEKSIKHKNAAVRDLDRLSRLDELEAAFAQESIYEQIREELERLDKLELEIKSKQQLARQDQERHAAYKRNKVETNRKIQQLAQVSQEKESILKQLRVVVNQLKAASSEQQASQIEENRRQLVRDFRKRKCIRGKLIKEISRLKEVKSELEEEIGQAGQQLSFEENEGCPAYVQIQLEIDELKTEKYKIEAKIGHQIFLRLP